MLSLTPVSKMTLSITIKKSHTNQNGTLYCYAECHYAERRLCYVTNKAIMISVVLLSVVAPSISDTHGHNSRLLKK
jgi:hypothetical protein